MLRSHLQKFRPSRSWEGTIIYILKMPDLCFTWVAKVEEQHGDYLVTWVVGGCAGDSLVASQDLENWIR